MRTRNNHISFGKLIWMTAIIILAVLSFGTVQAENQVENDSDIIEMKRAADYSEGGADSCLNCHDQDSDYPATKIFSGSHGSLTDKNSPMAKLQCETCHGPSGEHGVRRVEEGEVREPMISFDKKHIEVAALNQICSSCHKQTDQSHWQGSEHQLNDVACTDCHKVHVLEDHVQIKHKQVEVCGSCHLEQKLAAHRISGHPLKYQGQMGCSDCHNSHGSNSEAMLVGETINDTCYTCHAEKRGPFVWEHEPASSNCASCHASHGSNSPDMLVTRAPLLCQNCHSAQGHPSIAYTGVRSSLSSSMLLGRSCSNCHNKVHGSNHPSGNLLQR